MPETLCTQPVLSSHIYGETFAPVPADDLGFALSIFVSAANRTFVSGETTRLSEDQVIERDHFFADLLLHSATGAVPSRKAMPHEASLEIAFAALWNEHRNHELRDSICARVLCFYFLMERTEGRVIQKWINPSPERPAEVILDSVVVEGLASAALDARSGLVESHFLSAIDRAQLTRCVDQ